MRKKYVVKEYGTGVEVLVGTSTECADFLNRDEKWLLKYVSNIKEGLSSGKKHGYTVEVYIDDKVYEHNHKVLRAFYSEYWRSPTEKEFVACGGNITLARREGFTYSGFLQLNGYERANMHRTVEAVDQNGNVVFVGNIADIGYEYGIQKTSVGGVIKHNRKLRDVEGREVTLRYKEFTGLRGNEDC